VMGHLHIMYLLMCSLPFHHPLLCHMGHNCIPNSLPHFQAQCPVTQVPLPHVTEFPSQHVSHENGPDPGLTPPSPLVRERSANKNLESHSPPVPTFLTLGVIHPVIPRAPCHSPHSVFVAHDSSPHLQRVRILRPHGRLEVWEERSFVLAQSTDRLLWQQENHNFGETGKKLSLLAPSE
jgi:hypothetical protein